MEEKCLTNLKTAAETNGWERSQGLPVYFITKDISGIEGTKPFIVSSPSKAMNAIKEVFVTQLNSSGANLELKIE